MGGVFSGSCYFFRATGIVQLNSWRINLCWWVDREGPLHFPQRARIPGDVSSCCPLNLGVSRWVRKGHLKGPPKHILGVQETYPGIGILFRLVCSKIEGPGSGWFYCLYRNLFFQKDTNALACTFHKPTPESDQEQNRARQEGLTRIGRGSQEDGDPNAPSSRLSADRPIGGSIRVTEGERVAGMALEDDVQS